MLVTEPWLIIPDIHDEIENLDAIIKKYSHIKRRLALGDWFDSFTRTDATATAERLKQWIEEGNESLYGNHDIQYSFDIEHLFCSGFGAWKLKQIQNVMTRDHWDKIKLHTWFEFEDGLNLNPLLATHAGFHAELINIPMGYWEDIHNVREHIDGRLDTATDLLNGGRADGLVRAGKSRGGSERYGGVTWCDFREFEPIPGIDQVMGHTYSRYHDVRTKMTHEDKIPSLNVCIDTGLMHVVIVEPDGWRVEAV